MQINLNTICFHFFKTILNIQVSYLKIQAVDNQADLNVKYLAFVPKLINGLHILQGDEEKAKGLTPMPMMDREKKHELPQLEVI